MLDFLFQCSMFYELKCCLLMRIGKIGRNARQQMVSKNAFIYPSKCTHLQMRENTNDFHCVTFDGQFSVCCCLSLNQRRR